MGCTHLTKIWGKEQMGGSYMDIAELSMVMSQSRVQQSAIGAHFVVINRDIAIL